MSKTLLNRRNKKTRLTESYASVYLNIDLIYMIKMELHFSGNPQWFDQKPKLFALWLFPPLSCGPKQLLADCLQILVRRVFI